MVPEGPRTSSPPAERSPEPRRARPASPPKPARDATPASEAAQPPARKTTAKGSGRAHIQPPAATAAPSPTPATPPEPPLAASVIAPAAPEPSPLLSAADTAPSSTLASTLQWTPLSDAPPEAPVTRPARRVEPGIAPSEAPAASVSGTLVEVLREAPGLLAEAWSALEAAARAIRAGLGTSGGEQLDVYGRDARLSEAVAPLVDFLYSRWFRVEVEGAAHVPTGGALLVANHAGALPLDGPMLHEALRRERPELPEARWLAEDQVFYAPLLGTLFNRLGAVRASPDSATRLLGEGRPVLIFPEGIQGIGKPFRDRYRLQRFGRGGFVKLALRTARPILPVAIMGAEETLPLLGKLPGGLLGVPYVPVTPLGPLPLPAKWRIRIGEPIAVPPGAKETDLSVVEAMVEATRNPIEHMLRELLGARGGVFLG
ncbi:MAG: 1-acyl-sn-glycerol-3-phosphate acyltransferase [Myxococcaceae bacterium]